MSKFTFFQKSVKIYIFPKGFTFFHGFDEEFEIFFKANFA